jgi:hypothetical protein
MVIHWITKGAICVSNPNPPTEQDSPVKQSVPKIKNVKEKVVPLRPDQVEGLYWQQSAELNGIYHQVEQAGDVITGYVMFFLVNDDAHAITFANFPEFSCQRTMGLPDVVKNVLSKAINERTH